MDNTRTVTDAKQQKIKIKKRRYQVSMSTIVDRTCYVFFMSAILPSFHEDVIARNLFLYMRDPRRIPSTTKPIITYPHPLETLINCGCVKTSVTI
jgi:hypothetical protein